MEVGTLVLIMILVGVAGYVVRQAPITSPQGQYGGGGLVVIVFIIVGMYLGGLLSQHPYTAPYVQKWCSWVGQPLNAPGTTTTKTNPKQTLPAPVNATYNPTSGLVSIDNDPPAGSTLVIYWTGGLKIQDVNGGSRFPGKSGNIGTGATAIQVRFQNDTTGEVSPAVAVK